MADRGTLGRTSLPPRRGPRLQGKLTLSFMCVALVITGLTLVTSTYVRHLNDVRSASRTAFLNDVREVSDLLFSASEEGFSYVLAGDPDERSQFEARIGEALRLSDGFERDPRLLAAEKLPMREAAAATRELLFHGRAMFESSSVSGHISTEEYHAYDAALDRARIAIGVVVVATEEGTSRAIAETRELSTLLTLAIGAVSLLLAWVLGTLLGRLLTRPLEALRDAAVTLGKGQLETTVTTVATGDEIAELAAALEQMRQHILRRTRDLEHSRDELAHANHTLQTSHRALLTSEKMAVVGRLTAGVVHELNSPLAALMASVYELKLLRREYERLVGDPSVGPEEHRALAHEMQEPIEIAEMATGRAASFVKSIRAQTRTSAAEKMELFDLAAVVRDATNLVAFAARSAKCCITVEAGTPVELYGNASRLGQVVTNILQNAVDATGEHGGGEIRLRVESIHEGVLVTIEDEGGGIPEAVLPHIFEPLYTTKAYGRGTGLGLAIVKEAVEQDFGGAVVVDTKIGKGTTFTLRLPKRERANAA